MAGITAVARALAAHISEQPVTVLLATFVAVCIATRLLTANAGDAASGSPSRAPADAKDPPAAPYWIPWLGHSLHVAFGLDSFLLGLKKLYPTGVVSLRLLGRTHTVVFKPSLISSLVNQQMHIVDGLSVTRHLVRATFGYPGSKQSMDAYKKVEADIYEQYKNLLSESPLHQMVQSTAERLRHNIADFVTFNSSEVDQAHWERCADATLVENADGEPVVEASLFDLTRNFVAFTANVSLLGSDFIDNYPGFWETFWKFDEGFMHLAVDLPAFLPIRKAIAARRARGELLASLAEFEVAMEKDHAGEDPGPQWANLDNVGAFMQARHEAFGKLDLTIQQRAALDFSLVWAMNGNSNPFIFWMLWRVYSDPELLARIRDEIVPYVVLEKPSAGFGAVDMAQRIERIDVDGLLNKCVYLKAAYVETLRVDVGAWSLKIIREDTVICDKEDKFVLPQGTFAHGAHELHHMSPLAFPEPEEWKVERHIKLELNEEGEKVPVADMGNVRPFGGGPSMCKGRQYAVREILMFCAAIFAMYDMEPPGGEPWKLPKQAKSAGTKHPASSTKVWIRARRAPSETLSI